jgi:hypothetical protein
MVMIVGVTSDQLPVPAAGGLAVIIVVGELIQIVWFVPALAIPALGSTCSVTELILGAQEPLLIVHRRIFNPELKLFTELVGDNELLRLPVPDNTVQVPMPTVILFAASCAVGFKIHNVWFAPAAAKSGTPSTLILIVFELEQPPLVLVHLSTAVPVLKAVKVVAASVGLTIVPDPDTNDQAPVPKVGLTAEILVEPALIQSVWLLPGMAKGARLSTTMATVLEFEPHTPLLIVHLKIFVPVEDATKLLVGDVLLLNTPLPIITDQFPTPVVIVFADNTLVGELIHKDWDEPALARSGKLCTTIPNVAELIHPPLLIDHLTIFVPVPRPVIVLAANVGFVIEPVPETNDQLPMPNVAVLPVSVAIGAEIHTFWFGPTVAA